MESELSGNGRSDGRDGNRDGDGGGHRRGGRCGVHQRKRGGRGGRDGDPDVQRRDGGGHRRGGRRGVHQQKGGRRGRGGDGDRGVHRRRRPTSHSTGPISLEGLAVALFSPRRVHCPSRSCKSPTLLLQWRCHIDNQLEVSCRVHSPVLPDCKPLNTMRIELLALLFFQMRDALTQRQVNMYLRSFYFLPFLLCWYSKKSCGVCV